MFTMNESYWLTLKTDRGEKEFVNIKGKVVEENNFMVKILRDNGEEEIIPLSRITNVNKDRNVHNNR